MIFQNNYLWLYVKHFENASGERCLVRKVALTHLLPMHPFSTSFLNPYGF